MLKKGMELQCSDKREGIQVINDFLRLHGHIYVETTGYLLSIAAIDFWRGVTVL